MLVVIVIAAVDPSASHSIRVCQLPGCPASLPGSTSISLLAMSRTLRVQQRSRDSINRPMHSRPSTVNQTHRSHQCYNGTSTPSTKAPRAAGHSSSARAASSVSNRHHAQRHDAKGRVTSAGVGQHHQHQLLEFLPGSSPSSSCQMALSVSADWSANWAC